ncbi:MAG TPA: helix-turn-helix domain-containing protein [Jatrophihabitantaceae bacterium]|jgi:transcriptional regulator of acetoin/glycerol metabolism
MGLPARQAGVLQSARRALSEGGELPGDLLRDTIRLSWIRSKLAAAPMDRIEVPYRAADGVSERLVHAAEPILSRFADQLADTNVSIVLADCNARVVGRWAGDRSALRRLARLSIDEGFVLAEDAAGTNGVGTVLEELGPVTIFGEEHYSEPLQRLVCVGAPIRNPLTRRIEGVLDLACPTNEATGLLVPTLLDLSAQIEHELSAGSSARERIVFEEFLARSRETSAALVGLSEQYMVTNAAAADLLESRDQRLLWEQVARSVASPTTLVLTSGAVIDARCIPIRLGSLLAGTLIEFVQTPVRRPATANLATRRTKNASGGALAELLGRARGRICIVGEQGTGKLTTATHIHELLSPGEPMTIHPAGLAQVEGAAAWLGEFRTRLADPRGTVVVRNIEVFDDNLAQSCSDLLDRHREPQPLIIATRTTDRGVEHSGLQGRFDDAVLRLPPVRQRRDELSDLVHTILHSAGYSTQVGHRAMAALVNFGWPGNFPQLQQVVREAGRRARGATIGVEHLADEVGGSVRGRRQLSRLETLEREAIVDALHESGGNRAKAGEILGMSRSTLYRRLRLFGLDSNRAIL